LRQGFEFLASAKESGLLLSLALALNCFSTILAWRGEGSEALKHADALVGLAAEHGFSNWYSFGKLVRGLALAILRRAGEAVAEITEALESLEATAAAIPGWAYANLASSYLMATQPQEGLNTTAKALEIAAHTGDAEAKPELHRLHGELLPMSDPTESAEAEVSFRSAVEVARKQSAKLAELRATTSLARLLASQGRRDKARAMLADIYHWFTEGFDTADLKDAKALLDELSA
jgi:adenylate cyclase